MIAYEAATTSLTAPHFLRCQIMTLETHDCIWERGLRKGYGSRWKLYEEGLGSPTSVLTHSPEDNDSASVAASEEEDGPSQERDSGRNGHCPGVAAGDAASEGDWSQILDAHSLDEILSRLSLQSLAKLSCVSKGFQGVAQQKLLGSGALVDFREDLGNPYEPSMLRVPLRAADLPAVQRWDRYSVYHDLVSRLYKDLADASKGGLVYQRSLS